MITHAATGKTIHGHVLDVSRTGFNRALRDYDSQLYTVWNPTKIRGWGCWEIRRRPSRPTAVYKGTHKGAAFYSLEYVEFKDIHHVIDCAFLNYDVLRRLKEMDTWGNKDFLDGMESREEAHKAKVREQALKDQAYNIKQHRSEMRDFLELVNSGVNPAQVLLSTKW